MNDVFFMILIIQIILFIVSHVFNKIERDGFEQTIKSIDYHLSHIRRDLSCFREHYTKQITAHEMLVNNNILPPDRTNCIYDNICYEKDCEDCKMFLNKEE